VFGTVIKHEPRLIRAVCLTLLGTWPGSPQEMWQPGKSTILQVLVSIQAMIFVPNPFENEPGLSGVRNHHLLRYNLIIQAYTVRYAMLDWLLRDDMRSGIWREVARTYFSFHGEAILVGVKRWASSNDHICHYTALLARCDPEELLHGAHQRGGPGKDLSKQLIEALRIRDHRNR
jgi:hypothetical protein